MINLRAAAAYIPAVKVGSFGAVRSLRIRLPLAHALMAKDTSAAAAVPWTWADGARATLWAALLATGGALGLLLFRIALSLGFTVGEGIGVIHSGTFDSLSARFDPYATAGTTLLVGGMLYCSLLYGVYRFSIAKYRLPWSALGFCRVRWGTLGRVAALFVPVTLGGLIVMRLQVALLGATSSNSQQGLLTRGMAPLPLNFIMLFLVLAVLTPIAEETFFRGFLYRLLRKRLPVWAAASLSAAGFAALHGVPALFPWLFYMGVVFALVFERTRSIYSSIMLHGLANALVTLSIVVTLSGW